MILPPMTKFGTKRKILKPCFTFHDFQEFINRR
ncbi:hypothetical protein LTSEMIN_5818, partial [Salmonella enterica subsp. enterica serovar Minnesota str. A4-603]